MSEPVQLPVVIDTEGTAEGFGEAFRIVFEFAASKAEEEKHPNAMAIRALSDLMVEAGKILMRAAPEEDRARIFGEMTSNLNDISVGAMITVSGNTVLISEKE